MVLAYNLNGFPLSTLAVSTKKPKRMYIVLRCHSQPGVENYVIERNMVQCAPMICDTNGRTTTIPQSSFTFIVSVLNV